MCQANLLPRDQEQSLNSFCCHPEAFTLLLKKKSKPCLSLLLPRSFRLCITHTCIHTDRDRRTREKGYEKNHLPLLTRKIYKVFFFFFLKECDCCQKELGTTMPCSVLVPFKGMAVRAKGRPLLGGWWAPTSQRVNFAYCTDHRPVQGSHIESAINQLCFMKPSTFIYVWLFSSGPL